MLTLLTEIIVAFVPILLFLLFMKLIDSFKLVTIKQTLLALLSGGLVAIVVMFLNYNLFVWLQISPADFSRFVAPVTEEFFKILFIVYLIRAKKVGFMVDAAIVGFAVGAGFAIIENIYYMRVLSEADMITWFVRGFGTAVMHGGTTAIAAMISKDIDDRKSWPQLFIFTPGLIAAILLHSLYNQFLLPPITITLIICITLPPVVYLVFKKSEENTRQWLGTGLDSDMEMLRLLMAGNISETRIGNYLKSIQEKFPAAIVGDIICYLRVYLELSIKAKGVLIMKESGFDLPPDPETTAQFEELSYLEKHIGKTGMLAVQPMLKISNTDLWQLYMLQQG
ncbi:MAG: PrsW family intramembrane metalloprotease [Balneolaceae bacterium]|nr:MAG: PrsW family intramembrane metalloprotease [Balneolaceae bacterium]